MELVDRKTACLFSVCAKLGALVAGGDAQTEERLGDFAWNLGMAFQLIDDLLDFTAREQVLGKPVGNDLREGKVTLPLVYALERATAEERRKVETILRERNYERVPFGQVLAMIERYGGMERVKERAHAFTEKARGIICEFPESPYQRALYSITELITERDH
jgi:octaprenyl-diphosphate synthase